MSKRSALVCAALASAVAPRLRVTGARDLPVPVAADPLIDEAGLLDAQGRPLDVLIADGPAMGRLRRRADNAVLIADAAGRAGLDIAVDVALAQGRTRDEHDLPVYVVLTRHINGIPRDPTDLTEEECRSLGLAIARIHALDTGFLLDVGHTAYSGAQVRGQLSAWTRGLAANASVPDAIIARWDELLRIDTLWDFSPVVSHGGFAADDILFSDDSTVSSLRHWERLGLADPASDFSWLFDDGIRQWQRDEVLSGYGEGLGERMDPRIVPRARLWRQMTAVRSFLQALAASDHDRLAQARRAVNAIASSLSPLIAVGTGHPVTAVPGSGTGRTATKAERAEGADSTGNTGGTEATAPSASAEPSVEPPAGTGTETDAVSDETRQSAPVSDGMIDSDLVISGEGLHFSGTGSVSRQDNPGITVTDATGTHEEHEESGGTTPAGTDGEDEQPNAGTGTETGTGTGTETSTGTDTDARQAAAAARFATNTNMPAIQPDGTRTSLAAATDTRRTDGAGRQEQDARTRPFQTQAYIDTDAPDATVTVTHSTSVRERLFPDDPGEELFKPDKDGQKGEKDENDDGSDAGPDSGAGTGTGTDADHD